MSPTFDGVIDTVIPLTQQERNTLRKAVDYLITEHPELIIQYKETPRGVHIEIVAPKNVRIGHRGSGI